MLKLKVKKIDKEAIVPKYHHQDDAAFDLYSLHEVLVEPMATAQISTGIAMEIPDGYVGLIWDKSGLSHKHGLKTLGGVIDAGYRGEIKVGIINLGKEKYLFEKGNKVAQMIIQKREMVEIEEITDLSQTIRGEGGFGSTGK